eukprot:CAMPEP_0198255230 /NCGR_PEP_ID=MMETSP1447-20131203/5388_1 /TAXON_ID=420782 /ORGANISM="Chaetoceros dichaeta, Strain CCMP1751" /LENGTH=564 /DNA_ID=CAMNT_0043941549 /DNA_START=229 /DNA_END=1923 /DNA_ORIENTATION=+
MCSDKYSSHCNNSNSNSNNNNNTSAATSDDNNNEQEGDEDEGAGEGKPGDPIKKARYYNILKLAKSIIVKPISTVAPQNIANLLTDATVNAVDLAKEEVATKVSNTYTTPTTPTQTSRIDATINLLQNQATIESDATVALDALTLAQTAAVDAFSTAEAQIIETEAILTQLKADLAVSRLEVMEAIGDAERAVEEAGGRARSMERAVLTNVLREDDAAQEEEEDAEDGVAGGGGVRGEELALIEERLENPDGTETIRMTTSDSTTNGDLTDDVSSLTYDDVDYQTSEMSPPFIGEDQCLVPGEAVVRVEKAPENSRRIFAGIDIMASVDDVWSVLTNYAELQRVVPNLVTNEVQELYTPTLDSTFTYEIQPTTPSEDQCRALSTRMAGAKLKQIGGAKVVGINFSARTTLEVREWPQGIPDFFHFSDDVYQGESRAQRVRKEKGQRLERYHFPRPFAISKLPTKDISMQSVEDDDGEFRLYQGVWRMQPLPGCGRPGQDAMRLTYAVEISPRPYLPVALVEGRVSRDLCDNLTAIRAFVTKDDNGGGVMMVDVDETMVEEGFET